MKYCYNCSRITLGDPFYCNFCGKTYDLKLCSRLHPNPRAAQTCSQCGSKDLSTPQPKVPFYWKPILLILSALPGFLLLLITTAFLFVFLYEFFDRPAMQFRLMLVGLILGLLWYLYMQLPLVLKKVVQRLLAGRANKEGHRH